MTPEEKKTQREKLEIELQEIDEWMKDASDKRIRYHSIMHELEALDAKPEPPGVIWGKWNPKTPEGTPGHLCVQTHIKPCGSFYTYDLRPGNHKERDEVIETAVNWYEHGCAGWHISFVRAIELFKSAPTTPQLHEPKTG